MLAKLPGREMPASFVAFDLLSFSDRDIMSGPQAGRRAALKCYRPF